MNKAFLIGRLTRDPELRYSSSNAAIVNFSIAIDRQYTNAQGQRETDFINIVAFQKQAENIKKYVFKGSLVAVDGRIQTGSYDGQDGQRHYTTDIVADNVTFLGSRNTGDTSSSYGQSNASYQDEIPSYNEPQGMPSNDVSTDPFKDFGEEVALSDDDLPF